jgi:leader peptidase (prepilin peptidase)/N-methyltransferase
MLAVIETNTGLFLSLLGIIGLIIGSFLNVIIYRLPLLLEKSWEAECADFLAKQQKDSTILPKTQPTKKTFDLAYPRSHCPTCKTNLPFWQNIPLLSYLFLRGKCAFCRSSIPLRYPLVEVLGALTAMFAGLEFGASLECLFICLFGWLLITISFIDIETQLIPDILSQTVLWLGLLISCFEIFTNSHDAILGAILGYSILWGIHALFQLIRKKVGMGSGDFKLLAATSAWLGWQLLPFIILTSSVLGLVMGLFLIGSKKITKETPIPFAPFIAFAAWIAIIWGFDITHYYFQFFNISWTDV